ncbi:MULTISPECIES: hypothetical protein [Halorubrum]|nr:MULTISPECIES: hypothetical protein [Halorubrum]
MGKLRWLVLKTTGLLKPVYRRLGFFPYPGSVTIQHKRDTKSWHDTERGKQAAASLYEQRHTPVNTALLIAATIVLTLLVDISPLENPFWFTIDTVWQLHATIIGLSFVVLVFLLEIVSRSRLIEGALEQFLRKSWVMPVLVYSLLSNLALAALILYPDIRGGWISSNLASGIFAVTILGILSVYRNVVGLVLADDTDEEAYTILKDTISRKIQRDITIYEYDQILADDLPDRAVTEKTLYPYYAGRTDPISADDLGLSGVVSDIHVPTFVYGINEIIRIGEKHQSEEEEDEDSSEGEDEEKDDSTPVEVRVKIGDNLREFSSILYVDSEFFHEEMESVYPILDASILTRPGTGREETIRIIYKQTDFLDQEGKRIVRNAMTRPFILFMDQYRDVVHHSFEELDEARFLIEDHRYTNADLPFYDLDQILVHVFEEAVGEMNREFANHIITLIEELTKDTTDRELFGAYRRYMNLYSRFYFAVSLHNDLVPDSLTVELNDTLIERLGFATRNGIEADLDKFDELDEFDFRINSYSETALEEAHKIFKYAFENQDPRTFGTTWRKLNVPRNTGNRDVRKTIKREQQDLRFNAAAMTYDVAKDHEKYHETFEAIYNTCIRKTYHRIPELFEFYFRIKEKKGHRTRWGKWGHQEHDLIKQMHGAPYSLDPETDLGEFYCFTAIMNGYYNNHQERNPLDGETITEEEFRMIKRSVNELKRKQPFIDVRNHLDEEEFKERADKFLEYHEKIVDVN